MRRWLLSGALCLALVAGGCAGVVGNGQELPLPAGAPEGLEEITPAQFVQFMPVVNRYFYHRKKAVVAGDVELLWQQYPALKQGTDTTAAINTEADVVARYSGLQVIDGNIAPEHYARLMVTVDGDQAIVLVNGWELYLRQNFAESGGQLQILLYLERQNGDWAVVKTDETALAEYH